MKVIKSSLLILFLFFGLGAFAHAQFPIEPCTQQNVGGVWQDTERSVQGLDIRWVIMPELGNIICSDGTQNRCEGIYPNGVPFRFTFNIQGEMIILWTNGTFRYTCVRFNETLLLNSVDPEGEEIRLINRDSPENAASSVPTLSEWGMIAMAGVLGIVGFMVVRRKRATA